MRSVFYWRILIVSIIALMLANVILLAAYTYVGKNTYVSIEMANLEPEAEVTRQIYEEYKNGYMNEDAFQRLIEKQTVSSESAILISDALGKILIVRNVGSTVEVQDFGEYYRAEVQNVLRGKRGKTRTSAAQRRNRRICRHSRARFGRKRDRRNPRDQADQAHSVCV